MKGLKKYIKKHGKHFTNELAMTVRESRWNPSEIERTSDTMVYYNVSGATFGDIVFLVNFCYDILKPIHPTKRRCVKHALNIVGDIHSKEYAFDLWIKANTGFDFTQYI